MTELLPAERKIAEQNRSVTQTLTEQRARLAGFLRKHTATAAEAEDILQDVFYEFVLAYRLMKPIENAGAWLFRVARNRITDAFRKQRVFSDESQEGLPSFEPGPGEIHERNELWNRLEDALDQLPDNQREVFIAHELEGLSFKEIAATTGTNRNTLLSRKRYAVARLRELLGSTYESYTKGERNET